MAINISKVVVTSNKTINAKISGGSQSPKNAVIIDQRNGHAENGNPIPAKIGSGSTFRPQLGVVPAIPISIAEFNPTLNQITDVVADNPQENQALMYNAITNKYEIRTINLDGGIF